MSLAISPSRQRGGNHRFYKVAIIFEELLPFLMNVPHVAGKIVIVDIFGLLHAQQALHGLTAKSLDKYIELASREIFVDKPDANPGGFRDVP